MKNTRVLRISIVVIIATSALIGFAISYSLNPTASIARLLIDVGALVALLWIANSLPRPEEIHIDDIVDGLRDLARNRFDKRLSLKEHDELFQVRQAFNELAGTLSDSRNSSLTHIRYNPLNRIESKGLVLEPIGHSIHPELGQVKIATENKDKEDFFASVRQKESDFPALSMELPSHKEENDSLSALDENHQPQAVSDSSETKADMTISARPESYPSDIGTADFFFLFERFKAAHNEADADKIEFDDFLMTVQKTREELIRQHQCRDVKFDVVNSDGAVALRPRLVR